MLALWPNLVRSAYAVLLLEFRVWVGTTHSHNSDSIYFVTQNTHPHFIIFSQRTPLLTFRYMKEPL